MRAVSVVHLLICKCIFVKGNEDMIIKKTTSFRSLMGFIVTVSCQPNLLLETTFGNKSQLLLTELHRPPQYHYYLFLGYCNDLIESLWLVFSKKKPA